MRTQADITVGRVALTRVTVPRLQTAGGRRPPRDRQPRRVCPNRRGKPHLRYLSAAIASMGIAASLANAQPASAPLPNLSGTYRCVEGGSVCRLGASFTITQAGADLEIKNDKGETGTGKLTSNITLSAGPIWNMMGVLSETDKHTILWSNGTSWRKQ